MLSKDETYDLINKYQAGDEEAFNKLYKENLGMIKKIAYKYVHKNQSEAKDLYAVADIGFYKCVNGFDTSKGIMLSTYAYPIIDGECRRFLRDHNSVIRIPRDKFVIHYKIKKYKNNHEALNGYLPSTKEIATALDINENTVTECENGFDIVKSFNDILYSSDNNESLNIYSSLGEYDSSIENISDKLIFDKIFNELNDREKILFKYYFEIKISQTKIGDMLGIGQVQVSRHIKKLRNKIIDILKHEGINCKSVS